MNVCRSGDPRALAHEAHARRRAVAARGTDVVVSCACATAALVRTERGRGQERADARRAARRGASQLSTQDVEADGELREARARGRARAHGRCPLAC